MNHAPIVSKRCFCAHKLKNWKYHLQVPQERQITFHTIFKADALLTGTTNKIGCFSKEPDDFIARSTSNFAGKINRCKSNWNGHYVHQHQAQTAFRWSAETKTHLGRPEILLCNSNNVVFWAACNNKNAKKVQTTLKHLVKVYVSGCLNIRSSGT